MLELGDSVKKVKHRGHPLDVGIMKHKRFDKIIIEVDKAKAAFKGKKWSAMTEQEKDHMDDLLYLTNIQEADVRIIYT
jgi:hypothetical protein